MILQWGAVPVPVAVREEDGFMYTAEALAQSHYQKDQGHYHQFALQSHGGVASAETLGQIADLVKEQDLYVISDEIYHELVWSGEPYTSIAQFPGMKERTVVMDGFSKQYAMTGFRLGWGAAPQEVIVTMTKLLENHALFCQ